MKMPWEMPSDENAVHFKQRRGGRRVLVSIDDAGVSYQLRDVSGETIFRASHEQIDPEMSSYTEKNGWLLRTSSCQLTSLGPLPPRCSLTV